jgi:hypothetical protein
MHIMKERISMALYDSTVQTCETGKSRIDNNTLMNC